VYDDSVLSVLIAPTIILGSALLVATSTRALLALYRPLRRAWGTHRRKDREVPPAQTPRTA
jgi:hypothetical protein